MTEIDAKTRLGRMVAASEDPLLTTGEVADLLAMSALADADGLPPSDTKWAPTWDLNRGAAEGWRWKAAKASSRFAFTADGQTFDRDQVVKHCQEMARAYARRIACSVPVPGRMARSDD